MKAFTIKNPYAYLIVAGIKTIENRSWRTHKRERVYIHASQKWHKSKTDVANIFTTNQWDALSSDMKNKILAQDMVNGAILGEVDIVDCVPCSGDIWGLDGYWHWVLENPVMYDEPIIGVKGKLSFWEWDKIKTAVGATYG